MDSKNNFINQMLLTILNLVFQSVVLTFLALHSSFWALESSFYLVDLFLGCCIVKFI